jgi:IS5 family transposase
MRTCRPDVKREAQVEKGKDHKQYEYGNKVSVACTARSNLIVGVVSHELNLHDSHTLPEVLKHIEDSRGKAVKTAVCDRGYRGKKEVNGTRIMLPAKGLKRDSRYQRDKKRKQCKRRAAIEPIIGHLKSDFRLSRNFLKGVTGDEINLLMAATAWNLKKWLIAFFGLLLLSGKTLFGSEICSVRKNWGEYSGRVYLPDNDKGLNQPQFFFQG